MTEHVNSSDVLNVAIDVDEQNETVSGELFQREVATAENHLSPTLHRDSNVAELRDSQL